MEKYKVTQKQQILRYLGQRGMKNLNYPIDHILYQIFKFILSISLKNMKR